MSASDRPGTPPGAEMAALNRALEVGESIGEYVVEAKIGEGGFGSVYRVRHPLIGKTAACKVLSLKYSVDPVMVSRFVEEARAVNQINHRNIIDIFSFGNLPDGRLYYLMEYLDGQPLDRFLRQQGRLSPELAIGILTGVARALDAAHGQGIAHRDLKPENVFVLFEEDVVPQAKLLDFGIAKLLGRASGHKTETGTPLGTPHYMSPEQCRGAGVDHRTDIYSFGVLEFELLTGALPFAGESHMDVLMKHISAAPPRPSELAPESSRFKASPGQGGQYDRGSKET